MLPVEELRTAFDEAVAGDSTAGAERLCHSCVDLLEVDGAAVSLMSAGQSWGTLGASGRMSRRLDELQFTFGEGPCLDAVRQARPVLVADLGSSQETRWPAFTSAVLKMNIRGVFALPIGHARLQVGALDLYRHQPGALSDEMFAASLIAAEAATVPLLRLVRDISAKAEGEDLDGGRTDSTEGWERVEVYQATGMVMAQLDVSDSDALVRLRGYAFVHGMTAAEVAHAILSGRVVLADDSADGGPSDSRGSS